MMVVAVIGLGTMGLPMALHIQSKGYTVRVYDVNPRALQQAQERGLEVAASAQAAALGAEMALVMVATDQQTLTVGRELVQASDPPKVVAVAATVHPETMQALAQLPLQSAIAPVAVIDVPVVYGTEGVRQGTLLTLAGGAADVVERVRPILLAYSREVRRVGDLGAGQIAKMANNMLHWAITIADYEVLHLVKALGVSPETMRQVLQACPAANRTLDRWQGSRFTWADKDMDVALDVAQSARVAMPMAGLVDQLIKGLTPQMIADLMAVEGQSDPA